MLMSSLPDLSVIIPHLNEPGELSRCLAALVLQRGDGIDFEIIVVDNGSRTLPLEVCSAFEGVRLESEPVPGPGPARNRGAAVARAGLLAFIDADCLADPGWVKSIADFMKANPGIDFIGGDIRILPGNPERLTAIEAYENVYAYRAKLYVETHGFAATGNMAVRASVFQAVGPFGGIATMEDTEWGKRATAMGYHIGYLEKARVRTASCKSFAELARRWDRHVAHEFRQVRGRPVRVLSWLAGSVIVAGSPVAETIRIFRSDRLFRLRDRWLALQCLTQVRLYRARKMIELALHGDAFSMVGNWNREKS
jgi:GT2 family glycosyltransferase